MTTVTKAANSATNATGTGTVAWSNASNVTADDSSLATASTPASGVTNWIKILFSLDSSDVPSGATIDGISFSFQKWCSTLSAVIRDDKIRIVIGNTIKTTDRAATGTTWPTADGTPTTVGGSTDLWGETITQADVTSGTFGVALSANNTYGSKTGSVSIDYVTVTVYYTAAGGGDVWIPNKAGSDAAAMVAMSYRVQIVNL